MYLLQQTMKLLYVITALFMLTAMVGGDSGCDCPAVYEPACSTTGNTYGNECHLLCAEEILYHEGPCESELEKLYGEKE